ncbi:MAG: V-ATPase V1 sector subunit E [Chrysothrix sp. TS-e1954]|nr:MAG: V-ATPase V1 sector subunit E [Chrysothrix sp. TS-e1954]
MSDDQVASELRKMTAFIRQEALEKAREIQLKADEEFAIEKSKLVRQETSSIDNSYTSKFKSVSMSQQITRSTVANKTRLRILGARQELLDELFEKARGQVGEVSKKAGKEYQGALRGLVLEGLYALNEGKVAVRAREKDGDVVKKAMEESKKVYKEKMGKDVEIVLDEKNPLPEGSNGGIFIVGGGGKIDINNTFDERLKILQTDALPQIRTQLFGPNQNRKFTD